ncbi:MAG: hypothetical protein D6808_02350 [Candidatus Dadabacteria bacterium]|nr:MAG: hypothetical protein D6808_02350 [Candidatus Dadabacteria bacterium]
MVSDLSPVLFIYFVMMLMKEISKSVLAMFVLSLIVVVFPISPRALAEGPYVEFPPISAEIERFFFDLVQGKWKGSYPLEPDPFSLTLQERKLKEQYWYGSEAVAKVSMDLGMYFSKESGDTFSLKIEFYSNAFLLKLNSAVIPQYRNGVRIGVAPKRVRHVFLKGNQGKGVLLIIPPVFGLYRKGLVVCPRYFLAQTQYDIGELKDSGYALSKVIFYPAATASGRVETARHVAYGRAAIFTSKTVTPPKTFEDVLKAPSPQVRINYQPSKETPYIVGDRDLKDVLGGIKAMVELRLPAGFRRVREATARLLVKRLIWKDPLSVPIDGVKVPVMQGLCYGILRQVDGVEHYS